MQNFRSSKKILSHYQIPFIQKKAKTMQASKNYGGQIVKTSIGWRIKSVSNEPTSRSSSLQSFSLSLHLQELIEKIKTKKKKKLPNISNSLRYRIQVQITVIAIYSKILHSQYIKKKDPTTSQPFMRQKVFEGSFYSPKIKTQESNLRISSFLTRRTQWKQSQELWRVSTSRRTQRRWVQVKPFSGYSLVLVGQR